MSPFGRKKPALDRGTALSGRPRQGRLVGAQERPDGGLKVTVLLRRAGWQRWLGGSEVRECSFGLDAYGREVFEACDGNRTVRTIIRRFAKNHKVSLAEAEAAVTTFLKTLLSKGLVVMELDDARKAKRN